MGIFESDVISDGPYRQSQTASVKGCQIDYLLQTATNTLYLSEFKLRRRELGIEIIQEMQEKINALKIPRGYAATPVLFHLGGISSFVETQGYFYRIINIADFLEG